MENYGLILEDVKEEDYIFGAQVEHNIELKDNESFRGYFSRGEVQHSVYFDSMSCVTFSGLNSIEAIFNYQIKNKMLTASNIKWLEDNEYFDDNGLINFSDRFTASVSGTTRKGNSGGRVNQSIVDFGLVPEKKWSYPREQRTPVFDWDEYMQKPPQELFDLGKEFKKRFKINYETVYNSRFEEARKTSPLMSFVHAWDFPVNGVYQRTTKAINHAVSYVEDRYVIHDSYFRDESFYKKLAEDFIFYRFGYSYTLTQNNNMKFYKEANKATVYVLGEGDGLYHPIFSGKVALDVFASSWEAMGIEIITVPKDKIGYRIAGVI